MIDSTYCLLTYFLFCFYCISTRHMYIVYILDYSTEKKRLLCLEKMTWKMVS